MLSTVSYFVGAFTGRSAGFSPFRMRSSLSRPIALAPRTRWRSRPHGARRGGLGQVNSAERDVSDYNLERKRTSSTSSAGLPKRRAADTYPCVMAGPVLAVHVFEQIYSIHFERGPPCQKKQSRRKD